MMNSRINTAHRLGEILKKALNVKPPKNPSEKKSVIDGWCEVFKIDDEDNNYRHLECSRILINIDDEIRSLKNKYLELDNPEHLISPVIKNARNIFNIQSLYSQWINKYKEIEKFDFTSLEFINLLLSNDEYSNVDSEDFKDLYEQVLELEVNILASNMENSSKDFLLSLIELIKQALRDYMIYGAVAFEHKIKDVIGKIITEKYFRKLDTKEESYISKIGNIIDKISKWSGRKKFLISKYDELLQLSEKFGS